MFLKSDFLKTVVCLALIIVLFSAPVGADIVSVSDFNSLKAAVEKGGIQTILVSNDIDMGYLKIPANSDITLKPESRSVVLSFENIANPGSECIYISENSSLGLSGNGTYTLTVNGMSVSGKSVSLIANNGKFTLESGTVIHEHTSSALYAGVKNKGVFIMNGGEISHINGRTGGAVSVIDSDASFVMNGGSIKENTAETGAGIYLSDGSVTINGGSITGNTAINTELQMGGGIYLGNLGMFTMNGGSANQNSYYDIIVTSSYPVISESAIVSSIYQLNTVSTPDIRFTLDKPTNIIIPKYPIKIPVSLEVTNGKVSMIVVTLTLSDYSGNQVQGISYDYNIKDSVKFDVIRKEGNTLTLSTGTDITQSIEGLLTLTISDADLAPGEYTVTLEIESSVSNTEDYTKYPTQTLKTTVNVVPLILSETANTNGADKLDIPVWSFKQKAAVTYVISPFEASLEKTWPAVSRHASPSYEKTASELTEVTVYKSANTYDSANPKSNYWTEASSTVSKNQDGTIHFVKSDNDKDAKCFKIVFTGRKVGDVVEGTGDIDNVNLYDVDMILHAAVAPNLYIKPEWRLYADTNSDGKILLGDAINVFNFFKGYTA